MEALMIYDAEKFLVFNFFIWKISTYKNPYTL